MTFLQSEPFYTFTLGNLLTIFGGIISVALVYLRMNNQQITLITKNDNLGIEMNELKQRQEKLETKVENSLGKIMEADVERTLALQENTLAVRELRRFIEQVEKRLEIALNK